MHTFVLIPMCRWRYIQRILNFNNYSFQRKISVFRWLELMLEIIFLFCFEVNYILI